MQDIYEKLKSFAGDAGQAVAQGADALKDKASQAGDYLQANPTVAAMLAAGGGAGLLGGYLTAQGPTDDSESKASRRLRILRNALLAGGAGAGAVGLGAEGLKRLSQAVPEGSQNPVQEKLTSPTVRGIGGVGGAALGFAHGNKLDTADFRRQALSKLDTDEAAKLVGADPEEIIAYAKKNKGFIPAASDPITQSMGKIKSPLLAKVMKGLVGTTRGGQMARAGLGAGLMLPEVLGQAKNLLLEGE